MLLIREQFGLAHERQVLEIDAPQGLHSALQDVSTGTLYPYQISAANPGQGFVLLELQPFQTLHLREMAAPIDCKNAVEFELESHIVTLRNGLIALQVPIGEWQSGGGTEMVPGPIQAFQMADDTWRGRSFIDVRARVTSRRGWLEENGPVRAVACYRVQLEDGGFYQSRVSLDAAQTLVTVSEQWSAGPGDQIVWDFEGEDFPDEILLLDSTAGYTPRKIHSHFDQRHARLWCWTQQTQLHDLRDGFALKFGTSCEAPIVGFVTLNGGSWQGNRLNHLEAWTRRWWRNDPLSRRGENWDSKADGLLGSDAIPSRGVSIATPHFNVEGWLAETGERSFALVLTREKEICPPAPLEQADHSINTNHFEHQPERDRYVQEQSWLRRIHIQRGLFPLREQLQIDVSVDAGGVKFQTGRVGYGTPIVENHLSHTKISELAARKQWLFDYLSARVYGFWESGGLAYTNPVSSRAIAPVLFLFEYLSSEGHLLPKEEALVRAHLLFLASLFYSDNCYPGDSTMQPLGAANAVEPTLAGMANQNFFTDIFNTYGVAAQVFPNHPQASQWRAAFGEYWRRQLEFHTYPESGVWEESHTYYQHVLHTILPTCLRRRDDGAADDFANPRFQRMVHSALLQITPRDAAFGGVRHLVAFGDHHPDVATYVELFRELAHAFAPQNAELAAQLAWLYREMDGAEPLDVEPQPIPWESGPVQGLGYCFRSVDETGAQSLLALRSGGAWGHHHHDEGSIQFFAHGRALIVDSAFSHGPKVSQRKFKAAGHSRWSLADAEPWNYYWRFNRGEIIRHGVRGQHTFAVAHDPVVMTARTTSEPHPLPEPITHTRHVVQLAPTAFLVRDTCEANVAQIVRFHLPLTDFQVGEGLVTADYEAVRLYIVSLNRYQPHLGEIDVPKRLEFEHFATREISFSCESGSVFLICAQTMDALFTLSDAEAVGTGWSVSLGDLERYFHE